MIFMTTSYKKYRHLPSSTLLLEYLRHTECGGPTNYEIVFGCCNFPGLSPKLTSIRWQIGDFIDFCKPSIFREWDILSIRLFCFDQLLPIRFLDAQIVFRSTYFCTGWGTRQLTSSEMKDLWYIVLVGNSRNGIHQFHLSSD